MCALVVAGLISFLPLYAYAALTVGPVEPVSSLIKIPDVKIDPTYLQPIEATKAAGLDVAGATGGLIHPACVAETARRAAMKPSQPPPHGDFPCIVPTSNNSGIVEGVCFVKECRGVASTGLDGLMAALKGASFLGPIVSSILTNLARTTPGSPSSQSTPPQTPPTQQYTPGLILPGNSLTQADMSKLFNDSAVIVRDLLRAMNPPR